MKISVFLAIVLRSCISVKETYFTKFANLFDTIPVHNFRRFVYDC
jgi:hypothetical protein